MGDDPFELSQEETQVMLGRYAGASIPDLARSTGMPAQRVQAIVSRLSELGLLGDEADAPPPEPEPFLARARAAHEPIELPDDAPTRQEASAHEAHDDLVALLDSATFDLLPPVPSAEIAPAPRAPGRMTPAMRRRLEEEETPVAPPLAIDEDPLAALPPDEPAEAEAEAPPGEETREYRKLYEAELHPLPIEQRIALAGTVTGAKLFALCFDPGPPVIAAMFTNTATGIEHARLIAFHHRDPRGLDELAGRPAIAADPQVHRRLVRNPGTTEPMLRKLLGGKRLMEVHKTSLDRDVPERSRVAARALLRTKFATAQAEERVELVWNTEGRVLVSLTGATFDSRMTSILCSKTYASIMLVQSLARFPATPPALLAHLLRQPLVKRQQQLKNALLQHPNTPSEAKRKA